MSLLSEHPIGDYIHENAQTRAGKSKTSIYYKTLRPELFKSKGERLLSAWRSIVKRVRKVLP